MEEEKKKVYLRVKVEGVDTYFKAFENDQKTSDSAADYTGNGIRVWLNEAKPKQEEEDLKPVVEIVRPATLQVQARRL